MIILFDLLGAQPEGNTKFHGGGEHIKTVLNKMLELGYASSIIVFYDYSKFVDPWLLNLLREKNVKTYDVKSRDDLRSLFEKENIDVFYSALPYSYKRGQLPDNVVKIGTFHGLRPIEVPFDKYETLYLKGKTAIRIFLRGFCVTKAKNKQIEYYGNAIALFDKIICVSNHTKYAISNYYPEAVSKSIVIYSPAKYIDVASTVAKPAMIKGKYILLISVNRFEKNSFRALIALEELFEREELREYKVVAVGNLPQKIRKKLKHLDKYVFLDYVESGELENLYCYCDFFVYPTLSEGFGTPPLEAMKYGKTCCVSAVTSLPEVCGDSVYYFNPYDIDEIKNRILMAVDCKIERSVVLSHFEKMKVLQDDALTKVARFVCEGRD